MRVICLSGTLFNASIEELNYILDIFNEDIIKSTGPQDYKQKIKTLAQHTISYN